MVDEFAGYHQGLFRGEVIELACMGPMPGGSSSISIKPMGAPSRPRPAPLRRVVCHRGPGKGKTVEERARRRKETRQPLLEALHLWRQNSRRSVADGGALAKAFDYSLRRWPALARYTANGFYRIDNNPVENTIRPIAIGKKNWLFAGSEAASQRAAAIQSLLETARLNGIEPMAWLNDTLEKLPSWPNSRIDELLPLKNQCDRARPGWVR
jgi:transposase